MSAAEKALKEIKSAKDKGNIIFLPSAIDPDSFYRPVLETVTITDEDVYPSQGKWRINFGGGLLKLSNAAGVEWDAHGSCRTDDGRDKLYVSFRAVGMIRKADGKLYPTAASYDLDLELVKEELEEMYLQKGKKDNKRGQALDDYIHYCVTRDWLHKRKHKLTLAESGAKARVIRNILGIQSQYSKKQDIVGKSFTMVRFVLDNQNPDIKQAMLAAARDNMSALYGPGAAPRYLTASSSNGDGDVIDLPTTDDREPNPPPSGPGMDNTTVDFENSDVDTQVASLKELCHRKGYDLQDFLTRSNKDGLEELTPEKRREFFVFLNSL